MKDVSKSSKLIKAYYHIHLTDDPLIWSSIFLEQMKCLEDSGLLTHLKEMDITCIAQDDERIGMFVQLCKSYNIPIRLTMVRNPFDNDRDMLYNRNTDRSFTESITLKRIWEDCKTQDMKVLYFHSKGSTSYSTNIGIDSILKHKQYYYWRAFMNWAVLTKWAKCEYALDDHDVAGGDYRQIPLSHFCGNFWWATSDHIKQLPDPLDKSLWYNLKNTTDNEYIISAPVRMYDEFWIFARNGVKSYDVVDLKEKRPMGDCLNISDCERCVT